MCRITTLVLDENDLGKRGGLAIATAVERNTSLHVLRLANNNVQVGRMHAGAACQRRPTRFRLLRRASQY